MLCGCPTSDETYHSVDFIDVGTCPTHIADVAKVSFNCIESYLDTELQSTISEHCIHYKSNVWCKLQLVPRSKFAHVGQ